MRSKATSAMPMQRAAHREARAERPRAARRFDRGPRVFDAQLHSPSPAWPLFTHMTATSAGPRATHPRAGRQNDIVHDHGIAQAAAEVTRGVLVGRGDPPAGSIVTPTLAPAGTNLVRWRVVVGVDAEKSPAGCAALPRSTQTSYVLPPGACRRPEMTSVASWSPARTTDPVAPVMGSACSAWVDPSRECKLAAHGCGRWAP